MALELEAKHKIGIGVFLALCVIIAIIVGESLRKLDSEEVGLKYDVHKRKLSQTAHNEGLHTGPPGYYFIKFSSIFKTINFPLIECLNYDGIRIVLDVSYQYRARASNLNDIVKLYKNEDGYKRMLTTAGEAAVRDACSAFNVHQFQLERGHFQSLIRESVLQRYHELYCDITDLQVNNIARPVEFENAIQSKEAVKENIKVAENERPRRLTEAQTLKEEAIIQGQISVSRAQSDATIMENAALATAEAIIAQYTTEADTYAQIVGESGMNLTVDGLISYLGIRTIANTQNNVYVGMKAPAKASYVTP